MPSVETIDVEMDARYSNPTHSGVGNMPYQDATQMTQLVAENLTKEKKIKPGTVKVSYVKCVHWQGQRIGCHHHHTNAQPVWTQPTPLGTRDSGRVN